jgi:hypothetical protein
MSQPTYDEFEVRLALIHACDELGSQAAFARKHNVDQAWLGCVIRGQRPLGRRIPKLLGFERVAVRYIRKPANTSGESPRVGEGLVP